MTAERAAVLARGLAPELRRIPLTYDAGVYIGPTLYGALAGAASVCVASFALTPWLVGSLFEVGPVLTASSTEPFTAMGIAGLVGAVGTVVLRYFQQGAVEVSVDEEGIRETEAGTTRLFIPWRDARAFQATRHTKRRDSAQIFEANWVRFAAPSGAQIAITDADQGLAWPTYPRRTVARRSVAYLVEIARELPAIEAKETDPRKREYEGGLGLRLASTASFAVLVLMFYRLFEVYGFARSLGPAMRSVSMLDAASASAVIAIVAFVRVVVPFRHWRAEMGREGRPTSTTAPSGGAYRDAGPRPLEIEGRARQYEAMRVRARLLGRLAIALSLTAAPLLAHLR
jgi:hypothetical protein